MGRGLRLDDAFDLLPLTTLHSMPDPFTTPIAETPFMSLTSSTPKPTRMSARDVQICISLGQYKYLTTEQLRRLHFTTDYKTTVHNRMLQLRQAGFVSMRRIYTSDDTSERGAKTCVYFLRPENVRAIIT